MVENTFMRLAAMAGALPAWWYKDRDAYEQEQAKNMHRAETLAFCCNVSRQEIEQWQCDSGLSWDDFWQLANVINSFSFSSLDEITRMITW